MRQVFLAAIVFALVMPAKPSAHRLDEYLQATRLSFARDRIILEVDLTPGVSIAPAIVTLLDRDGDQRISPIEAGAYGQGVLSDLVVELDGRAVRLTLTRVEAPSIGEMRDGSGTIQVRAVGAVDTVVSGRRRLDFRNNHQPAASVYLVNALRPHDGDVAVVGQVRDPRQRGVRIEYEVHSRWPGRLVWLVFGVAGVATFFRWRPTPVASGFSRTGDGGIRL
jgi:hypothetical protein